MSHKVLPRVPPDGPNDRWFSDVEEAIRHFTPTITPVSVAANTSVEQTFTLTGINSTDTIIINAPSLVAGVGIAGVRSTAKDTIGITFINATGSGVIPASGTYNIIAIRG